jgi:hypothetical protein
MKPEGLPDYLIVAAAGEFQPGLAVRLQFGMKQKMDFTYIAFIEDGPLTLSKAMILERFDRIRKCSLSDYADPRSAFEGRIEAEVLTSTEIRAAIKHCHAYAGTKIYPPIYLKSLEASLRINPKSDCLVACEQLYV